MTPTDEALRSKSCLGKNRFTSKRSASGRLRILRKSPNVYGPEALVVYPCKFCRGWHIGHDWRVRRPTAVKTILATSTETVIIRWRWPDGAETREERTAPERASPPTTAVAIT